MMLSYLFAVLGLAMVSNAHIIMNTPVPYGKSTLNNSPLDKSGSDFPCKQRTGVYALEGAGTTMALGSTQPLAFTGSATHGGGSCQISITYDKEPTKDSTFKVIKSFIGGCPMQGVVGNTGDNADAPAGTYSFTVPDSLPTGEATLAWTWFNKVGNREIYMNCAPITITGGSSKRDEVLEARNATQLIERDQAAFNALPDMFVANLLPIKPDCGTLESYDVIFPNPGDAVEFLGGATATQTMTPSPSAGCGATAVDAGTGPASTTANASPAASTPAASATAAPSLTGGVFATVPSVPTTLATSNAVASPAASTAVASAPAASSSAASPAAAPATGSGTALSGACTTEGQWNCIGGTSFQQCASGAWSVVQPLAAGTKCTAGESAAINIEAIAAKPKRGIRFSNEHVRRHVRTSW